MINYNHLNKEQRNNIEYLINLNKTFTYISKSINVDRTTISKEIKRNRLIKSNFYDPFDKNGINSAISKCDKLLKPPYVCNSCPNKKYCTKHKLYYNAKYAQENSDNILVQSRSGVDISPNIIDEIENTIVPLIKNKNQSINQVYSNHSDVLYFSKTTFYKYVNLGILSLSNLDLPKKVKYKKRRNKVNTNYKRNIALLKNRTYEDYLDFIIKHPKMNVCEMDTVEGIKGQKVFLTILIKDTKFMFIRLLDNKNTKCVNKEIDKLKELLGIKLFSKVFRIILTDNGSEFFDPTHIEIDYNTGNKTCNVFYCKPYSSYQKPNIERNHEYIRRVFPKGYSLNNLTDIQVQKLETTINNIPRDKFKGKTPYELTKEKYPLLIEKLNYKHIDPDDVTLTKENILGDNK
ncbi:MAG: IS30 family transposase [bacterium]|nr:IS30 family transposase [bacterium]